MAVAIPKICDPHLYRLNEAIQTAKSVSLTSPDFELDLVRFLQARCTSGPVGLPTVSRGLDILCEIVDESRLIAVLRPFLGCGDPPIVAKCVMLLGRKGRSIAWLNRIMAESDDGLRANLIESLWKRKEPEVELVLRSALKDLHPRVAANAVYGLYLLGIDGYVALGSESRSATWVSGVMNETDDRTRANLIESLWRHKGPEVELVLRSAVKDPHPRVAANAVHGLRLLGIDSWIEGLERLVGSEDAAFRISGIWVLKSSAAPDSPARIKPLIRDADPGVRHAAFDAIRHLREHSSKKTTAKAAPSAAT